MDSYDVIILGVGAMGSAAMYELAKRGVNVCGIEQFGVAHDRGSSHGETRMMRKAYFEHPDYIPLLHRTYDLWQELQAESGTKLFVQNGLLVAGSTDSDVISGLDLCYSQHPLPHEKLNAAQARRRFPQFHFDDEAVIYYDPLAGFLLVEKCVEQNANLAVDKGAALFSNERVLSWQSREGQVSVTTEKRQLQAEKLIITTGAWAKPELEKLGIKVEIWRKVMFWYRSTQMESGLSQRLPCFYFATSNGGFYGFPAVTDRGIKVGEHESAEICPNPEQLNRELRPEDEPAVLQFLQQMLPGLPLEKTGFAVCMYTVTPDHHFIVDFHPEQENVILAAGFSGHGFKFAPVIGEILGDLTTYGTTTLPADFLRLQRFDFVMTASKPYFRCSAITGSLE